MSRNRPTADRHDADRATPIEAAEVAVSFDANRNVHLAFFDTDGEETRYTMSREDAINILSRLAQVVAMAKP